MSLVHRSKDGMAVVDPDCEDDACFECSECGGPYGLTREEALQAAGELLAIAHELITDEGYELASAVEQGCLAMCGPRPLRIADFPETERIFKFDIGFEVVPKP